MFARLLGIAGVSGAALLASASGLPGAEPPLRMQLSPAVSREPTVLTIRLTVQRAADNRRLQVVAESPTFYRSSEIQLDGEDSPPLSVFQFRNLPTGTYQVTSVLMGVHGPRGTAYGLARIEPAGGSMR